MKSLREELADIIKQGFHVTLVFSAVPANCGGPGSPPEGICTLELRTGRSIHQTLEVREHHAATYSKTQKAAMLTTLGAMHAAIEDALDVAQARIETFTTEDGEEIEGPTSVGPPTLKAPQVDARKGMCRKAVSAMPLVWCVKKRGHEGDCAGSGAGSHG